jgi:hypothetical protein
MSTKSTGKQTVPAEHDMTVEQARRVQWLRTYPRPLGELLDGGYLTRGRLEWAASKAFDPELKQAARVLLEHFNPHGTQPTGQTSPNDPSASIPDKPMPVGMTLDRARATLWPFGAHKGRPMGELVHSRQLTMKDLVYGIENAWDDRVRQAAIALLLVRLEQAVQEPAPAAGPLRVVSSGRSYAVRRQFLLTLLQGLIAGAALMAAILQMVSSLTRLAAPAPGRSVSDILTTPAGVAALGLVIIGGMAFVWLVLAAFQWIMGAIDRQIEHYRKGQEGEERVTEVLRQALDGNWTLCRNLSLPGRNRADLDLVLVGPYGVWVLEVKNLTGAYRCVGERWEYRSGRRWKKAANNPSRQVKKDAGRLANFLLADGIKQWVTPVVVWANPEGRLSTENPTVAVWPLDRVADELGNALHGNLIAEAKRQQIIEKLTTLCAGKTSEAAEGVH